MLVIMNYDYYDDDDVLSYVMFLMIDDYVMM